MYNHNPLTCPDCDEEIATEFEDFSDECENYTEALPVSDHCEHCGEPLYDSQGALRGVCGDSDFREDFHSDV